MPVFPPLPHSQSRRGRMELDLMTRVMRMVVDDSHAEIAVHNGNLDGQEDQKFGGVNEDVLALTGKHLVTHPLPVHLCSMAMHNILKT